MFLVDRRILKVVFLQWLCALSLAGTLPENWRDLIDSDVLVRSDNDQSRYDTDKMEGDINNLDIAQSLQMTVNAAANAIDDKASMWPNNTIPYGFTMQDSTRFRSAEVKMVKEAMGIIGFLTGQCVKFVERTTQTDYIKFQRGPLSFSDIGRTGGRQFISLSSGCLERYGCIQHELMHALGFYHEQSRLDRDDYLIVNWDNIAEADKVQFAKRSGITYGLPYDYESVMHYETKAFAIDNELPTILPKLRKAKLGQGENLSPMDLVRIYKRFNCGIPNGKAFVALQSDVDQSDCKKEACSCECGKESELVAKICQNNPPEPVCSCNMTADHATPAPSGSRNPSFPKFSADPMSREECAQQFTQNCHPSQHTIEKCHLTKVVQVNCNEQASSEEIKWLTTALSKNPFRATWLIIDFLDGERVNFDNFAPIKEQVTILDFKCFLSLNVRPTGKLNEMQFPNLLEFGLAFGQNLNIKKADFARSTQLRRISFWNTTFASIEKDTFTDLPQLTLLSLEHGLKTAGVFNKEMSENLHRLHCGCDLKWFRIWWSDNQQLQKATAKEMYSIPDAYTSYPWKKEDIFLPIDCVNNPFPTDSASLDFTQTIFSLNEPSCTAGLSSSPTVLDSLASLGWRINLDPTSQRSNCMGESVEKKQCRIPETVA